MARTDILVEAIPGESRIAILEDGRLAELIVARAGGRSLVGNIYLGRVVRVVPAIDAAFVDIGRGDDAFLGDKDVRRLAPDETASISDLVHEGEAIAVQVSRDAFADKSAKVTARITLPGRYLVYRPTETGVVVSRKIAETDGAREARAFLEEIFAGAGDGAILRTAAVAASEDDLRAEVESLRAQWAEIEAARHAARPPAALLEADDPLQTLLRDRAGAALGRITIDDRRTLARLQAYCRDHAPEMERLLTPHDGAEGLFAAHGVDEEVAAALEPEVPLPCGGRVIIEPTAALTAIDVDAGPAPPRRANLEAAAEIARQIRLRGIAGQIVIDFVSTRDRELRDALLEAFREALAFDGADSNVFGFTRLGLIEMTRRRSRPSLAETLTGGTKAETAALDLIRETLRAARTPAGRTSQITASRAVVALLTGPMAAAWREVETRLGRSVALEAEDG